MRKQSKMCCGKEMHSYWLMSCYRNLPDGPKDIPIYKCGICNREIERFDELNERV